MKYVFSLLIFTTVFAAATFAQNTQTRTLGKARSVDQAPEIQPDFPDTAVGIGPYSVKPLLPGSAAPKFEVTGSTGNLVRFNPQHLEKPIVITFFRGSWCPYCVTQFSDLQNIESTLVEMGYDIWFISPDEPDSLSFGDQGREGAYQLYSDPDLSAAKAFGIAYKVKQVVLDRYFNGGRFLTSYSGLNHGQLPVPSSFIISMEGRITFQYTNPNHTQRIESDLLLAAARSSIGKALASSISDAPKQGSGESG